MQTIIVHITKDLNGDLVIEPDTAEISKKDRDQIEWVCDFGAEFSIDFRTDNNCPFEWVDPKQKQKDKLKSGRIKFNAKTNEYYKYDVESEGVRIDPEVSIKP